MSIEFNRTCPESPGLRCVFESLDGEIVYPGLDQNNVCASKEEVEELRRRQNWEAVIRAREAAVAEQLAHHGKVVKDLLEELDREKETVRELASSLAGERKEAHLTSQAFYRLATPALKQISEIHGQWCEPKPKRKSRTKAKPKAKPRPKTSEPTP